MVFHPFPQAMSPTDLGISKSLDLVPECSNIWRGKSEWLLQCTVELYFYHPHSLIFLSVFVLISYRSFFPLSVFSFKKVFIQFTFTWLPSNTVALGCSLGPLARLSNLLEACPAAKQ